MNLLILSMGFLKAALRMLPLLSQLCMNLLMKPSIIILILQLSYMVLLMI